MTSQLPQRSKARIGCAGWSLPAQYRASFPTEGSVLERYAGIFNAVEINSSFYRAHQRSTYVRWAESVPSDFRFSVKVPRSITHDRRLKGIAAELAPFLEQIGGLGIKHGGVLVQLPPSLRFTRRVASAFFERLRGELPRRVAIACEPRHGSWFNAAAEELLMEYRVNRVGADLAPAPGAETPAPSGPWRYWRLHGSPRMYYSNYESEALSDLARDVLALRSSLTPWIIFDNTAAGHAVGNALSLRELLHRTSRSRKRRA